MLPENNILETTLIGTGGGYGESVVLHLGNQNWIVVDSCCNPYTGGSLPLEYLNSIGVNVSKDVKLVICTHWHDDHILGMSDLFDSCKSAIFSMAIANDRTKFLSLVGLDNRKIINESTSSSTKEIEKCLEIITKRQSVLRPAVQDRVLLSNEKKGIKYQIISLSPSDFVLSEFSNEISTLITEFGKSNKRIVHQTPNDKSVVLYIKINDHRILLGSDLEVSGNQNKGWSCILNNCQTIDYKSSMFKIPHHGSETGYNKQIWENLIDKNAVAKLTPWNRGTKLPSKKMLETYLKHTPHLYSTSLHNIRKNNPKKRDRSISKAISKFNSTLTEIKYYQGIVQSRININSNSKDWVVNLLFEARKISKEHLDNL